MNNPGGIFDYQSLSKELKISEEVLAQFVKEAQDEFPDDKMMAELHIIRALKWYKTNNFN